MKKFVCSVCGYIHEGDAAPERCPVCKVPAEKFNEVVGEMKLAAEHEYGIYAKTVKNNPDISAEDKQYIFDQLMANFNGECSERSTPDMVNRSGIASSLRSHMQSSRSLECAALSSETVSRRPG